MVKLARRFSTRGQTSETVTSLPEPHFSSNPGPIDGPQNDVAIVAGGSHKPA
jgi:hypothetical protein